MNRRSLLAGLSAMLATIGAKIAPAQADQANRRTVIVVRNHAHVAVFKHQLPQGWVMVSMCGGHLCGRRIDGVIMTTLPYTAEERLWLMESVLTRLKPGARIIFTPTAIAERDERYARMDREEALRRG